VELLVSITILALATTVALVIYDQARLAFKQGENVTEQQQVVRIAMSIISNDVRMAGYNSNPDGNNARPDEQIEYASSTAITLRADFDADDPVDVDIPEQTLGGAGAAFLAVSTGNDEIVSYVLAKEDGSSGDTLEFGADVGDLRRDGTIESVAIGRVDLTQLDPPYTLYKLVLENDPSGCCGDSFARRIPIVDNVRSLRFRYWDRAGVEITTLPEGEETDAARAARGSIRRVGIEIEALTRDSDPHWYDANDPDPETQRFRKFRLEEEVAPPNLGRSAIKDLLADSTPPSPPSAPTLYPGHCEGLYITWPPNPPQDEVAYYRVEYGTDPVVLGDARSSRSTGVYVSGLVDGVQHFASVQAVDAAGNRSSSSPVTQQTTANTNTPAVALSLAAADGVGQIDLQWGATTQNDTATTGDPASPMIRDLAGYRLYRSETSGFVPSNSNRIADEVSLAALPSPMFTDLGAPHCVTQFYKVTAVDQCALEGAPSAQASATSWTDVDPIAPFDVQAFLSATDQVTITWSAVQEDVNGNPLLVDRYKIYRSPFQPENIDDPASWSYLDTVTSGATSYVDSIVIPSGQTVHYLIQAVDRCSPPNESVLSDAANPICFFSGRVELQEPAYGATVWRDTNVRVAVTGATPTVSNDSVRLKFLHEPTGNVWTTPDFSSAGFSWQYFWDAHPSTFPVDFFQQGSYLVTAEVEQGVAPNACSSTATIRVHLSN
jgi:hypothetical protein